MAKSTKGGLGRGLDALLGSYEDTVKATPAPAPAARPAQIPAPSQRRLEEEEVLEREEINETYPEDNIHIKGVVQRRAAVQAPAAAAASEVVPHEPSPRVVEKLQTRFPSTRSARTPISLELNSRRKNFRSFRPLSRLTVSCSQFL